MRAESLRSAERAALKAAAERVEAAKRAEAAARATIVALKEEREIAEAKVSAQQQALMYAEVEMRRRELAGPQPHFPLRAFADTPFPMHLTDQAEKSQQDLAGSNERLEQEASSELDRKLPEELSWERRGTGALGLEFDDEVEPAGPAWLSTAEYTAKVLHAQPIAVPTNVEHPPAETLQDYRERVAARWFALKEIFEQRGNELPPTPARSPGELRMPLTAVFSIAGGVGKTSLVATLGRALASAGEKVMLIDTTSHGLLPFYYGARELRPGLMRTFSQPQCAGEPVSMAICEAFEGDRQPDVLARQILRYGGTGNQRLMLDVTSGASWILREIANLHPTVLVPIAPDMNSVISVQAVETLFRGIMDSEGRPMVPYYVLNQFDAALPLHLDVREVFRRKLGRRLLQFTIRQSSAVSEALAEGMTVMDYASSDPVARDYMDLASWLRSFSPLAKAEAPGMRWGER
jgi:cellulose synthase operon protein YhjQ